MNLDPQSYNVYVNLILMREQKILLLRRAKDVSLFPGYWHCPAGKIEGSESPKQTIVREVFEEIGLAIDPFLGTTVVNKVANFKNGELIWKEIGLFFVVKNFEGEPVRKEPHLHDAMEWF